MLRKHICALRSPERQLSPAIAGFFIIVLYVFTMTASVPDGISFSDLQDLMANAPQEQEPEQKTDKQEFSDRLHEVANKHLDAAIADFNNPLVHKSMMMIAANNMVAWHTRVAESDFADGDTQSGTAWMRDAGKWQAIMDILLSISLGPDDDMLVTSNS